jgi:hypothetical protein
MEYKFKHELESKKRMIILRIKLIYWREAQFNIWPF